MNVFEQLFTISTELFIVTNGPGQIQRVNPRWKDILGYEPSEIEGTLIYDLFHPDDIAASRDARAAVYQRGMFRDFENRCIHKNGKIVWMKWHAMIDPKTEFFYGTGIDVTSEKVALHNLERVTAFASTESSHLVRERERATILQELIESSKDGFGYCDPDGEPVYLNRFLVEELGWRLDHVSIAEFLAPTTRELFYSEIFPAILERAEVWEGEVEYLNVRTGEAVPIWQKTFCSVSEDGQPRHIAFFATDLRTKRRAEAAIFHSSKMASLGQMAAGIAHEVNNPITIIHGTSALLKKAILGASPDPAKIMSGLERIEKTALRISRIVRGLRMFSRSGENDPPISTALDSIVSETLDLCSERFRDYAIDLQIGKIPEVSIRCRPTQISQVLLNLLNNSFDAVTPQPERWIRIDFVETNGSIRISVTDNGPGIPEETQRRLMEPFFTTKEPGKGTGLGLPISRGIIEEHGGKLQFERDSEHTRFVIQLPCTAGNPST